MQQRNKLNRAIVGKSKSRFDSNLIEIAPGILFKRAEIRFAPERFGFDLNKENLRFDSTRQDLKAKSLRFAED
jgi:hypothetical protein